MYSHLATLEYLRSSRRPCLRTLEAVRGSSRRVANFSIQGLFPGTGFFYKKPLCRMLEKGFQRRINREVSVSVGKSGASAKQPFYLQSDQLCGKFDWPAITKKREFLLFFSFSFFNPSSRFHFLPPLLSSRRVFLFRSVFVFFFVPTFYESSIDYFFRCNCWEKVSPRVCYIEIHGTIFEFNGFWDRIVSIKKKKRKREKQYRDIINYYNKHDKFLTRIF